MPITFPTPTTIGEQFASGGKTWQWNGYAWDSIANASALGATGATGPSANLSNYVLKAGDTMTGKLVAPADLTISKLNIGNALSGVSSPATTVDGDIWISNSNRLAYKANTSVYIVPAVNSTNTFTSVQTIDATNNASPALRVTQKGLGEAFRVEDESPDTTPFVVSASGRVGVGVTPDATVALSVDSTGIKFGDGTIQTTAGIISNPTGVTGADAIANIISLTQLEYDAIVTPNPSTLYIIAN